MERMVLLILCCLAVAGVQPARAGSGTCGDNLHWDFDSSTGTLTISGTGEMDDYEYPYVSTNQPPWWNFHVTALVVEEGVTRIGDCAFPDQVELVSASLPAGLRSIGEQAFSGCTSLASINFPQGLEMIEVSAFSLCASLETITLLEGLHTVGDYAFAICEGLRAIALPESMDSIGVSAFGSCHTLATATLPRRVRAMGNSVFLGCYELASITWPEKLTSIPDETFMYCGFEALTIPEGVTEIGDRAFADCIELASIQLPQGITSIGEQAFYSCDLLPSITLPASITHLGDGAFSGCPLMTVIGMEEGNTLFRSVDGVLFNSDMTELLLFPAGKGDQYSVPQGVKRIEGRAFEGSELESVQLPDGLEEIGEWAFAQSASLRSVAIPDGITVLEDNVFNNCSQLLSVTLPQSLAKIDNGAFFFCSSLPSVTLPSTVQSIENNAFAHCMALHTVTSLALTPPTIGEHVFDEIAITVYVPTEAYEAYQATPYWQDLDLQRIAGSGVPRVLAGNVMVQSGEVVLNIVPEDLPEVNVYDMAGRCVLRTHEARFTLPRPGMYVLQVGREAVKVAF